MTVAGKIKPQHIAVIGGGRWARVVGEVLLSNFFPALQISFHSRSNFRGMARWLNKLAGSGDVTVTPDFPNFDAPDRSVAIIANAASDHFAFGALCINQGVSTLVEKPFTNSLSTTRELIDLATVRKSPLAPALVFGFPRYINNYAHLIKQCREIYEVEILWSDKKSESRYGETKTYDLNLPIFWDCLPHCLSILRRVFIEGSINLLETKIADAETEAEILIQISNVICRIKLQRNGRERQRKISALTNLGPIGLDFSDEPGTIEYQGVKSIADRDWEQSPRPLLSMLKTFIENFQNPQSDSRFSLTLADDIASLCHQIENFILVPKHRTSITELKQ